MNTIIKTPEQIEVAEIFARLKTGGLSYSDMAREIKVERSYISMLAAGKRNPPPRTLQQVRELEVKINNAGRPLVPAGSKELAGVYEQIAFLERHNRADFDFIKKMVEAARAKGSKPTKVAKATPAIPAAKATQTTRAAKPATRRLAVAGPRAANSNEVSSKPVSGVQSLVKKAVKGVERPPVVYGRKRKAV